MDEAKIFFKTEQFYSELLSRIKDAKKSIDLVYLAYVGGTWTAKINDVLIEKVKKGCTVRLLNDPFGTFFEDVSKWAETTKSLYYLKNNGVRILKFHPTMPLANHIHTKMCLIDSEVLLYGSSNIADHCVSWEETNFLIKSDFCKYLSEAIEYFSDARTAHHKIQNVSCHNYAFYPSIPGTKFHLKQCFVELIRNSTKYLKIDTWYFLPDKEIIEELITAAKRGVKIQIMTSHKNRFQIINLLNFRVKKLLKNYGIEIYEWKANFRHHKLYWNDKFEVLAGSANLDLVSLYLTSEILIKTVNETWNEELNKMFSDCVKSL